MKKLSLRVYVITASVPELGRTHEDVAAAAIAGGADVIQFRDKMMPDNDFKKTAEKLLAMCGAKGVPLILNDRVEIAIEIGADGVHVGHEDISIADLRRRVPPEMIVGVSARNFDEAAALAGSGADYLGVGPIFATPSKTDASEPIAIDELRRICRAVRIPVVAIGGITAENLAQIVGTGAAGAAVIAAVSKQPDMTLATARLCETWERAPKIIPRA